MNLLMQFSGRGQTGLGAGLGKEMRGGVGEVERHKLRSHKVMGQGLGWALRAGEFCPLPALPTQPS